MLADARRCSYFELGLPVVLAALTPARHNPSMKKKKGPVADNWKKEQLVIRKPTEVVHPVDPEPLLNPALLDASRLRTPIKLSPEELERRTLLLKEWSRYKMKQQKEDLQRVQELERCGEEALKELKKSSLHLYHESIKQGSK